jgi:hypothetical protein
MHTDQKFHSLVQFLSLNWSGFLVKHSSKTLRCIKLVFSILLSLVGQGHGKRNSRRDPRPLHFLWTSPAGHCSVTAAASRQRERERETDGDVHSAVGVRRYSAGVTRIETQRRDPARRGC